MKTAFSTIENNVFRYRKYILCCPLQADAATFIWKDAVSFHINH